MKKIICSLFFLWMLTGIIAQPQYGPAVIVPGKLSHPELTERFYKIKEQQLFWFRDQSSVIMRAKLVALLDDAAYLALDKANYHYNWIKDNLFFYSSDTADIIAADKIYTDAVIGFCKSIYQGYGISSWIPYDELSVNCEQKDNDYIISGLSFINTPNELEWFVHFLEPIGNDYISLEQELKINIDSLKPQRVKELCRSVNLLRWIKHFHLEKYVVVNAGAAVVRYYEADSVALRMKAVVGTAATPTPGFAAYCNAVVLYPYWNVPYSIAVKEILPIVKRDVSYLDSRGLQVIDANGKILNPYSVNWSSYSSKNFPLQFRQSTGCDNALGVIKFNLTDPYSVYMHDTNNKTAFLAGARYFSHGCIRLEKPVELAMQLLPGMISSEFLEACYKNQKPVTLLLDKPVPVFVVYSTAEYDEDGAIHYYKDVYRLIK